MYNTENVNNKNEYMTMLNDRFNQRKDYLNNSDLKDKPELLEKLRETLVINS